MANLETRVRLAVDSILDNEALRSGLDDEAARALLDWGGAWAKRLTLQTAAIEDDTEAEESVYPRMKALRSLMRGFKDLALAEGWSPESVHATIETMLQQARVLFGSEWRPPADFEQKIGVILQSGEARARLLGLLAILGEEAETSDRIPVKSSLAEGKKPEGFFARLFRRLRGG
ncbi:MAG: hypothetical protein N2049_00485 [Anaerolineales bacterium]|nr:hypothetical protein [Anaerolineales bacterium]MCX7607681.1 hypothetical protein [Anaerolineales bacterium]MDW8226205.1 hypothetical protein [Anaerolineales bacterium]